VGKALSWEFNKLGVKKHARQIPGKRGESPMNTMKWIGLLVAVVLMGTLAAQCAAPAATPQVVKETVVVAATPEVVEKVVTPTAAPAAPRWQKRITIGWTPPDITGVFRTATDWFVASASDANKHGFDVLVVTRAPASHTAFADQVAIIEDYIARKVDVIAISPIEVEPVIPALQKANAAGIPIIVVNLLEPIAGVDVASYIGFDNTDGGRISAHAVLDYFGGPGVLGTGRKVDVTPETFLDLKWWQDLYKTVTPEEKAAIKAKGVIIEGVAGGFFSTARLNGFHEVVDQYPGIEILGKPCAADWNREKGIKCAENFLGANPKGTLDFIWAASNEMGLGAMLATQRLERTEVKVFTNDVTPESCDRIRDGGLIAETTHGFVDWGWYGGEYAVMLACGEKVPPSYDIRPRTVYPGNVDLYFPEPKVPAIDWETIKAACK
jgi:ribose transport system substrate-binding protein